MSELKNVDGWACKDGEKVCRWVDSIRNVIDDATNTIGRTFAFKNASEQPIQVKLAKSDLTAKFKTGKPPYLDTLDNKGLDIRLGKEDEAKDYIESLLRGSQDDKYWTERRKPGWLNGNVFLLPGVAIPSGARAYYSTNIEPQVASALEEWRLNVSMPTVGQERMMTAICSAFAGPLLRLTGTNAFGINLYGASTIGKTTALECAASVWGSVEKQLHRANATVNSLEAKAEQHNDTLLALDELQHLTGEGVHTLSYLLGNAQGKSRLDKDGQPKETRTWLNVTLCTAEKTYAEIVREKGQQVSGGSTVRMLDVPAQVGPQGIVKDVPNAATFLGSLQSAAKQHYGTGGPAFIAALLGDAEYQNKIAQARKQFLLKALTGAEAAQVQRVADSFSIVAAAGELATAYEVTGWESGEATKAVLDSFEAWLGTRSGGREYSHEEAEWLKQLHEYWQANTARVDGGHMYVPVGEWNHVISSGNELAAKRFLYAQGILTGRAGKYSINHKGKRHLKFDVSRIPTPESNEVTPVLHLVSTSKS